MTHQHSWQQIGTRLQPRYVIDDWQGVTHAVVDCKNCQQAWLLYLTSWRGERLEHRCYALAMLERVAYETFLHNVTRDYCDLGRREAETDALIHAASGADWALSTTDGLVTDYQSIVVTMPAPVYRRWQDIDAGT